MPENRARREPSSTRRSVALYVLLIVVLLGAIVLSILYIDQPVADAEMSWRHHPVAATLVRLGYYLGDWGLGPLLIAWVLIAARDHWQRLARTIVVAYLFRTGVVEWLKFLTGRPRPYQIADASLFCGPHLDYHAFPSGHASFSFMFAAIVAAWFPRWRWLAYILAVFVSATRVVNQAHFVSDIIAGAVVGSLMAEAVLRLWPPVTDATRARIEEENRLRAEQRRRWAASPEGIRAARRARRRALGVLFVVLGMGAALLAFLYLDPLSGGLGSALLEQPWVRAVAEVAYLLGTWHLAPLMLAVALLVAGWRWRSVLRSVVVGYVVQTGLTEGLKYLSGRPRPREIDDPMAFFGPGSDYHSFPSGHASFAFMFATVIGGFFPRARWPLYLLAAVIASSRVVMNGHYVSDVVFGAFLGILSGWLVLAFWPPRRGPAAGPERLSSRLRGRASAPARPFATDKL